MSQQNPKTLVTVLGISMLFIGICGISYEYTFSRLASDILGNSVKQWGIIIGLMMLFMGIGADLQKYFPDDYNVDNFIFLEIVLGLLGGIGPTLTLFAFGHLNEHFVLVHYFFICSIGLLIGLEIPLLSRVNQITVPSLKDNLGLILKMDYIGSFVGALVWVFILPRFFNVLEISFFLGIVNVSVALFTWLWFSSWMRHPKLIPAFGLIALAILTYGLINGKQIAITAEQALYKDQITYTQTTPYQRIVITEGAGDEFYLYINGHLQFSSLDEHIYHEFLVHPVMAAVNQRKKILILGGGDGLAAREVLKYPEVESITLVDIDPEMTTLAANHPGLSKLNEGSLSTDKVKVLPPAGVFPGEKINLVQQGDSFFRRHRQNEDIEIFLYHIDAFNFVEGIPGIYDLIIIDFPDPNSEDLAKLFSHEFYTMLKSRLSYDGLLIQQSSSPARAKEVFLIIGRSMQAAGFSAVPIHQHVPSFGDWGWWIAGHEERYSDKTLRETISRGELPENVRYITGPLINASMQFGKEFFATEHQELNTLMNKKIYEHYIDALKQHR